MQKIDIIEPSVPDSIRMGLKQRYEEHHGVRFMMAEQLLSCQHVILTIVNYQTKPSMDR